MIIRLIKIFLFSLSITLFAQASEPDPSALECQKRAIADCQKDDKCKKFPAIPSNDTKQVCIKAEDMGRNPQPRPIIDNRNITKPEEIKH